MSQNIRIETAFIFSSYNNFVHHLAGFRFVIDDNEEGSFNQRIASIYQ